LKKQVAYEKEEALKKQGEEIDKLKTELRQKSMAEEEKRELQTLRDQLSSMHQTRVDDQNASSN
jgi:cell fate (sporulation/competence/biofilm development) regulator YmcA (YheA/YmcA/DUF963 family)